MIAVTTAGAVLCRSGAATSHKRVNFLEQGGFRLVCSSCNKG
jgi:hypothetical protein